MADLPITNVTISKQTATVSRAGFGTPIFFTAHRAYMGRVRAYTKLSDVAEDFDTTENAYIAAQGIFSGQANVAQFKIARIEADVILTPQNVAIGEDYSLTVNVPNFSVTASYTALGGDTEEDVVDALLALIVADTDVSAVVTATKVGVGASATLKLAAATGAEFSVTDSLGLGKSFTTSETAAQMVTACENEDGDFYFVTAENHTVSFVQSMAAVVGASKRQYVYSSADVNAINNAYSDVATDAPAKMKQSSYDNVFGIWTHQADTKFAECYLVGVNAKYAPDVTSVTWFGLALAGLEASRNSFGNVLTATQRNNLSDRNIGYIKPTRVGDRFVEGKEASGEFIDITHTIHTMEARIAEQQELLLLNNAGGKVPATAAGINSVKSAISQALSPFVNSGALTGYTVDISNATVDNNTRTLTGISFKAFLAGAIHHTVVDGVLTF